MADHKEGHRKRVKTKYFEKGESAFFDYELLEMLLFYSIPRKDTKDIAKALLEKFGSVDNVLNADIRQLKTVEGIGKDSACLIKLVADLRERAIDSRKKQITIRGIAQAGEHFRKLLANETKENFAAMVLDNGNRIQFFGIVKEGSIGTVDAPLRELTYLVTDKLATGIIIAHNHPKGVAKPSAADVNVTIKIRDFMKTLGVVLLDHIIIGSNDVYSMHADPQFKKFFE